MNYVLNILSTSCLTSCYSALLDGVLTGALSTTVNYTSVIHLPCLLLLPIRILSLRYSLDFKVLSWFLSDWKV